MALEDNTMVMPVNGGGLFGGDNWAWIILLLLLGWGNNGWGNNNGNGNIYPWMNQTDVINGGFRDQAVMGAINGVQSGVQGLATQMCNGFAGVEAAAAQRQMADMQQAFANQMAMNQGFNGVTSQLANCCCENRLATANLQSVIQTENCGDI